MIFKKISFLFQKSKFHAKKLTYSSEIFFPINHPNWPTVQWARKFMLSRGQSLWGVISSSVRFRFRLIWFVLFQFPCPLPSSLSIIILKNKFFLNSKPNLNVVKVAKVVKDKSCTHHK